MPGRKAAPCTTRGKCSAPEAVNLGDLFDKDALQQVQDAFASAVGVASIITHPDGVPFTRPSNFTRLCGQLIRGTPKGRANCYTSDAAIGRQCPDGPILQPCLSGGLWDAGASITLEGRHVGNWLIGQVRNEAQDEEQMLAYADEIGADWAEFRDALREVPRMTLKRFREISDFLFVLAKQLSERAHKNWLQAQAIRELDSTKRQLEHSRSYFQTVFDCGSEAIFIHEWPSGRIVNANLQACVLYGYGRQEMLRLSVEALSAGSPPYDQHHAQELIKRAVAEGSQEAEWRARKKGGELFWVELSLRKAPLNGTDSVIVSCRDITGRKKTEATLRKSEEQYRQLFENAPVGIFQITEGGGFKSINPEYARMFGYETPADLMANVGEARRLYLHPEERDKYRRKLKTDGQVKGYEAVLRRKEGEPFWVSMDTRRIRRDNGDVVFDGFLTDITERKKAELALAESEERFRRIVETANEGILSLGCDGIIVYANPKMEQMLGYGPREMLGMPFADLLFPEDLEDHKRQMLNRLNGKANQYERRMRVKGGAGIYVMVNASSVVSREGEYQGSFAMFTDITEQKRLEEQLLFRALHDPLTGLANRTLCLDRISLAQERARRGPGGLFAVVFLDLDRFKVINDSLGHQAGDVLLVEVGRRLRESLRSVDTLCRYGGDEFVLVMEGVSPWVVTRAIRRVRDSLKRPVALGDHEMHVEASYGVMFGPVEHCRPEDMLRNANIALHQAKSRGRNRIVVFKAGMHEAAIQTMSLQGDMRRGLDSGEFFMAYQPLFCLKSGRVIGLEALMRWRQAHRGDVPPSEFIAIAEETGFIFELGNFALERACQDMAALLSMAPEARGLTISVNLSPRQFSRQGLLEQIGNALSGSGLPPSSLVLEVTESSIMKHPTASAHILERLKERGVRIAIDDFGTGYSSMSALQRLPLDRLKIDKSFVGRITERTEDREIVRAIITLARSLHLQTVAEGIEYEEQRSVLRELGCDSGQGFLCSPALSLEDLPSILRDKGRGKGL